MNGFKPEWDKIRTSVVSDQYDVISFDVYDTVVTRPFIDPIDLFYLLDRKYEEFTHSSSPFNPIRLTAEMGMREMNDRAGNASKDIGLSDIYEYIHMYFGISDEICESMMQEEIRLETEFSSPRRAGMELYKLALSAGKRVVFVSDMYLDKSTMESVLRKNGYEDYEEVFVSSEAKRCKWSGDLFPYVAKTLRVSPEQMLHIGDNYESDVVMAQKAGLHAIQFPSGMELFYHYSAGVEGCKESVFHIRDIRHKSIGHNSMLAQAANWYFDNPYRQFHDKSFMNADPAYIGYFALGMHLMGICSWLEKTVLRENKNRIIFLARDGYMPREAFDIYAKYHGLNVATEYRYASRKAVIPLMLRSSEDFMERGWQYKYYTPEALLGVMAFCARDDESAREKLKAETEAAGIRWNECFGGMHQFHCFMNLFTNILYDKEKHENEKAMVMKYFSDIDEGDLVFDMGYQGTTQDAIVYATGKKIDAAYIHADSWKHFVFERREGFHIHTFYDSFPNISGIMREFMLSDIHGSCVGYRNEGDAVYPIIEEDEGLAKDLFPVQIIQEHALRFVNDFCSRFHEYFDYIKWKDHELVLPFEGFLNAYRLMDRGVFRHTFFEDQFTFGKSRISVNQLWLKQRFLPEDRYNRPIAVWGTGKICREYTEQMGEVFADAYIDNSVHVNDGSYAGKPLIPGADFAAYRDYFIVIACAAYEEVGRQLENAGLRKGADFIYYFEA